MKNNKVVKYSDFIAEDTYKPNKDGVLIKQEWELYKDWHPKKFTMLSDKNTFLSDDFVWVIKNNENIFSVISSKIEENILNIMFEALKNNTIKDEIEDVSFGDDK